MSTSRSAAQRADRVSRLAVVEDLRELLRQHGDGGTLVDTETSSEEQAETTDLSWKEVEGIRLKPGSLGLISGSWSSGKTSLVLNHIARATREGQRAAIVDGTGWLFPPALALMGNDLKRTLLVQPPPTRTVWAAEQVLRSGLFPLLALLEPRRLDRQGIRRLQLAAERGEATGLLVQSTPFSDIYGGLISLRLRVESLSPALTPHVEIAAPIRRCRVQLARRGEESSSSTRRGDREVALA